MDPERKMGFIEAPLETVRTQLVAQLKEIEGASVEERPISGSLQNVLRALLPPTVQIERRLFVPTEGPWTAYLDNFKLGTDRTEIASLSSRTNCRGVHFVAKAPHTARTPAGNRNDGAVMLSLFGPGPKPGASSAVREIHLFGELDKWVFRESGAPLPFEDTNAYRRARVEERFTIEMLERYLRELGIRAFDEDFYRPAEACLISTRKRGG